MSLTHYITKARFSVWMSRIIWPLFWYYDTSWHKTYDWLTKFRNTFQTIPAIYFQQRNRHLAPPVSPCYAQASPNKIFQGRSLKGPGKGDILELTKLADYVYLMYILQVLVVLFVCFRVPWSIHPGRLRSSQSSLGASVSVWFRSKEIPRKGTCGFDRARTETRAKKWKRGSFTCDTFLADFDPRSSFFSPKPHRNACYAGYSQSDRGKRRDETSSARACKLCRAVSPDLTDMLWDCPWVSDDGSVVTITLVFASHTPLKTTDSIAFLNYRPKGSD